MRQTTGPANPFIVGQWVRGEEFYGRAALIDEILAGPRDGVWLLGTRRVGKTSLLKQLEHLTAREDSGFFPLFWDFQGAESLGELSVDFHDALLDVEDRLEALGIGFEEVRGKDLFASLGKLRRVLRSKHRKLLLLCDEVEELIQLKEQDLALPRKLRHALQSFEGIRSVLASSVRLRVLAERDGDTSPFLHGFLPPLYIHRLSAAEARSLIRRDHLPASSRPDFGDEEVEAVRRRCGDHPQLVQLLAMRCLELGSLAAACEDVAADATVAHHFAVDFDSLSGVERLILLAISERGPIASSALRGALSLSSGELGGGVRQLESLGLLRRDQEASLVIANRFFRRWLRRRVTEDQRQTEYGMKYADPGKLATAIVEGLQDSRAPGQGTPPRNTPEELLPLVYDELRCAARGYLRRERPGHTLQATALVHEAYLKLVDQRRVSWQGRTHFFAVGARAMRRLLIDHARGHRRDKRGGSMKRVTLNEELTPFVRGGSCRRRADGTALDFEQLLALDAALEKLRRLDRRRAEIVELRFFAGLTIGEVALHLGLSKRTVNTDWSHARAWLEAELAGSSKTGSS